MNLHLYGGFLFHLVELTCYVGIVPRWLLVKSVVLVLDGSVKSSLIGLSTATPGTADGYSGLYDGAGLLLNGRVLVLAGTARAVVVSC